MTAPKPRLAGGVPVPSASRHQSPAQVVSSLPAHTRPERARTFRIEFPARQELLNANQRLHWAAKARITKQLRSDAFLMARYRKLPRLERIHVFCVIEPDPRTRRRDPGNWAPSAKALVDGLVDAGVLPDDDSKHLVGPDMRLGGVHPGGRLVLIIHELLEETSRA